MFISEQMSLTRELDIEYMSISLSSFLLYCLYQIAGIVVREKEGQQRSYFHLWPFFWAFCFVKSRKLVIACIFYCLHIVLLSK